MEEGSSSGESNNYNNFYDIIEVVFNNWTAMKLAVENETGGTSQTVERKLNEIAKSVLQMLSSNEIEWYDVSYFLAESMDSEFHTVVEDNSCDEVAVHLCHLYKYFCSHDIQALNSSLRLLSKNIVFRCTNIQSTRPISSVNSESNNTGATQNNLLNIDGWTVVKRKDVKLKFGPMPPVINLRVFARGVMILATLAIVYFTSKTHKETILAPQKELVQGRGQNVICSIDYTRDLKEFPDCMPKQCGRFVSDRLVTETEAEQLLDIGRRGLALGSAEGGAAILDLHSGALSQGRHFINIYSLNNTQELFSVQDFAIYRVVRTKIQHAVAHHFGISADALYLTHPTFFSQLTDKPAVTAHDEYWHPHVDKDTYEAFHYTSLLYLTNYKVDFQGGRFIFLEPDNSTVVVEPRKGRVSMFTSGKENLHHIEPVTSGVRYALTVSFTCDKKYAISDPSLPATN